LWYNKDTVKERKEVIKMMEKLLKMLEELAADVDYGVREIEGEKPEVVITVDDFEGFDDDWSEVMRDYDEEAVDGLIKWLEENCISEDGDFYSYYHFEEFDVELGYTSFDI
jgi:hypothetical protein